MADSLESQQNSPPLILSLNIKDKNALYNAYMPFVSNGGVFVPTGKRFHLGDGVLLLLALNESDERIPVEGKIIWMTPARAQGKKPQGVGIQFSDKDGGAAQRKIETILAGSIRSIRTTQTM
jgi:type IV pilus assembly protein PilZ